MLDGGKLLELGRTNKVEGPLETWDEGPCARCARGLADQASGMKFGAKSARKPSARCERRVSRRVPAHHSKNAKRNRDLDEQKEEEQGIRAIKKHDGARRIGSERVGKALQQQKENNAD